MKSIPIFFGEIAVKEGYITPEILQESLQIQANSSEPCLLGEILVSKGCMGAEQVNRILRLQQTYKGKIESEYFAHSALKMGLLSRPKMMQLRRLHQKESGAGSNMTLPALAVANDYLSMEEVENIVHSSEYQYFMKLKAEGKVSVRNYEIIGEIAPASQGIVYKAIQVELDRLVAVKILDAELEEEQFIRGFFSECKITARFNHPNLIRIYDIGYDDHRYFYAMELVEGDCLADLLTARQRLMVHQAIDIVKQVANAVDHIHSLKIVHGDLNPSNIVLRDDGVIKVMDLGFARVAGTKKKLRKDKVTSTPQYMAPEQVTRKGIDTRTDVYCLGATFYHILTGQPPVTGDTPEEILKKVVHEEPRPISDIDYTIPEDVAKIVQRMMRKAPEKRYQEMKHVQFALKKILL